MSKNYSLFHSWRELHQHCVGTSYSFTSESIAKSLIRAKERVVDVKVILDESGVNSIRYLINQILEHTIPIWIDFKPAIADNKVVIIDNQKIITRSFKFSDIEIKC